MRRKFDENIPDVIKSTCAIFDVNRLVAQDPSLVTEDLQKLFMWSTEFGLFNNLTLEFSRFSKEYAIFSLDVQLKVLEMGSIDRVAAQNKQDLVYLDMLTAPGPSLYPNVLRLLSLSAVRTCNESFIEGNLSQIMAFVILFHHA